MQESDSINLRIVKNFEHVASASFWPSEIEEAQASLTGALTFKELEVLLNHDFINRINRMQQIKHQYNMEYKGYLNDLNKLKNTFSYDIDFI